MREELQKIELKVKKQLDRERFRHTQGVMYTAASLAMIYDPERIERAMIAGLLHDCAKCLPSEKKISVCEKRHIPISEAEYANPGLLHAKLGAYYAEKKYGVTDREILDAIRYHTTGRPAMTLLDKIIYIADYIEPNRAELPNMKLLRELAFRDLDECLYRMLADSLAYLKSRNIPLDPMTAKTCHYYESIRRNQKPEQKR